MPVIKKRNASADSSIKDAAKAVKNKNKNTNDAILEQLGGTTNELDLLNERLNQNSEPDSVREMFEQ